MKRIITLSLMVFFCLATLSHGYAIELGPPMIRVGLYYGTNALPSANLENFLGSGYRLGYYDRNQQFVQTFSTNEQKITMSADNDRYITVGKTGTSEVLLRFDCKSAGNLVVWPSLGEVNAPVTWFKGLKYAGAFEYIYSNDKSIEVVNIVSMKDYIKGVIPYEMGNQWPIEALKAQALCSKDYALSNIDKHSKQGFNVCASSDCQTYKGVSAANEITDRAVDETFDQHVVYQGKICNTFFHSSSGGYTENSENVWYEAVPYLKAVESPNEDLAKATNGIWQSTYTNADIRDILREKGYDIGEVVGFYIEQYTPTGNALKVIVEDSNGKKLTLQRENIRIALSSPKRGLVINSLRFTIGNGQSNGLWVIGSGGKLTQIEATSPQKDIWMIGSGGKLTQIENLSNVYILSADGLSSFQANTSGTNSGEYQLNGLGWGHSIGMSQWGARSMAEQGYTYIDIIKYYFTGVEILNTANIQ